MISFDESQLKRLMVAIDGPSHTGQNHFDCSGLRVCRLPADVAAGATKAAEVVASSRAERPDIFYSVRMRHRGGRHA